MDSLHSSGSIAKVITNFATGQTNLAAGVDSRIGKLMAKAMSHIGRPFEAKLGQDRVKTAEACANVAWAAGVAGGGTLICAVFPPIILGVAAACLFQACKKHAQKNGSDTKSLSPSSTQQKQTREKRTLPHNGQPSLSSIESKIMPNSAQKLAAIKEIEDQIVDVKIEIGNLITDRQGAEKNIKFYEGLIAKNNEALEKMGKGHSLYEMQKELTAEDNAPFEKHIEKLKKENKNAQNEIINKELVVAALENKLKEIK